MDSKATAKSLKASTPSKLELNRKDSGYISSSPTPATSSTEGTVIRRSLSGARVPTKSSSGDTSPETDIDSPLNIVVDPASQDKMQRTVLVNTSSTNARPYDKNLPLEDTHQFVHLQQQHTSTSPAPHTSTPPTNLNTDDRLLLAFKCRGSHTDWNRCTHPYCYQVRKQWDSFKKCCADFLHCCPECSKFKEMMYTHSKSCTNHSCPVPMCSETKNLLQAQKEQIRKGSLVRSQSFHEKTPISEHSGLPYFLSSLQYNSNLSFRGLGDDSVTMEIIERKAQEIMDRLDKEEPLLGGGNPPVSVSERPRSLNQEDLHGNPGVGPNMLSPIVEMREDLSLNSPSDNYQPFEPPPVSLILRSNHFESYGAFSSLGDGPGEERSSLPSQHSSIPQPVSMVSDKEQTSEAPERVYPRQSIEHKLNNLYLVPGQDGFYFQDRNYYLNDVDSLGSGGFGTCMFGKDHTTEQPFAMKRNKVCQESIIDSMRAECFVLSRLKPHENVISFLGAVIDEEDDNILLPRVYKMFMELADCGNLSEMLVTDAEANVKEPLPLDQSLYYIEQILQGVHFLHQNSVLHLDIKSLNVLVFSGGRTVKLADFGTAVQLSEISAVGGKIKGCTPYFAAPEVVREETPAFSSDIWSVMCVLVELLTANLPGCYKTTRSHQQMIFLVGQYEDCNIEQLIPFSEFEEIDEEIQQLIRWVFTTDQTKRPSALTLLNHPRLREAPEYVSVFDQPYDYDEEMSTEVSYDMMQQGPTSLVQVPSISGIPPSQVPQVPLVSHVPSVGVPFTPSLAAQYQTSFISGPPSLHVHTSLQSSPYPSMDSDRDHPSSSFQPNSRDSEERLSSLTTRGYPLRCVTGCGSGGPDYKTLDSGVETAVDSSTRSKFSNNWSSEFPTQSIENHDDYHSFPFTESTHNHNRNEFERSASITGPPTANSHSHSMPVPQPRKLVPSTHRLYHSYSAPVVGDHPRKLSLQMNREKVERPRLRRTSSMVYVDKGPEIDSPDREKRASIEELISDVSGLNLDACSPSHFKGPAAESDTHNTETVVRHYGRQGQDSTAQKPVTVYETIC